MPLQNRVDPFGDIHAVSARGLFTGNRGIIHDPATRTLLGRRWTTKAWIICSCEYKGRPPRDVMGLNGRKGGAGWTELFFLDEVTALAAGHRPCFTCRREAAKAYAAAFGEAFGVTKPTVQMMDIRLHAERLASAGGRGDSRSSFSGLSRESTERGGEGAAAETRGRQQILGTRPRMTEVESLPDAVTFHDGRSAYALREGRALPWSFDGYGDPINLPTFDPEILRILTPQATIEVLKQGYEPVWHSSAAHAPTQRA